MAMFSYDNIQSLVSEWGEPSVKLAHMLNYILPRQSPWKCHESMKSMLHQAEMTSRFNVTNVFLLADSYFTMVLSILATQSVVTIIWWNDFLKQEHCKVGHHKPVISQRKCKIYAENSIPDAHSNFILLGLSLVLLPSFRLITGSIGVTVNALINARAFIKTPRWFRRVGGVY